MECIIQRDSLLKPQKKKTDTIFQTTVGITQHTERGHIARATLEATCHQTAAILDAMAADSGHALESLAVDGGLSNSDLCMQTQADISGIRVDRPAMRETTALGAAIAADLGLDPAAVAVKATTNEGMGFVGRREGIAALAVATTPVAKAAVPAAHAPSSPGLAGAFFALLLVLGLIQTLIVFDGTLSSWWTRIAIGVLLLAFCLLQRLLARRNPLGLLSEDLAFEDGEAWGNFPQTYSHVGLISAAMRLSRPWQDAG